MAVVARSLLLTALAFLSIDLAGCIGLSGASGSFERALTVSGPVRLELQNGSGRVKITAGEEGQVRIHGDFRVQAWPWEDSRRRAEEIAAHPPIEQKGNLIHVGFDSMRAHSVAVNYVIVVPTQTEVQTQVGSGALEVRGIRGPAKLTTGSGSIAAEEIGQDTQCTTGSGHITLSDIEGAVRATARSGGLTMSDIHGDISASTGSGAITIAQPGGRITAKAGSGSVTINGAGADLRVNTRSGHLTIAGNPAPKSYWELRTGSGGVDLGVPANASFRLYAHSRSSRIDTGVPIVVEEQSKRELRARIGDGSARVEVRSGSGGIHIR